ncbi:MAG: hypothetical protein ISR65_03070 [Bacteriovoracaceae bacterium]|nr:hypothetical protein [Bacteriovoracaceae bacterium]
MEEKNNKFRKASNCHDEVRSHLNKAQTQKSLLTIWQGNNIKGVMIKSFAMMSKDITLAPVEAGLELDFDPNEPIFLYCDDIGFFIKTSIIEISFQAYSIKVAYPKGNSVKLLENRDQQRIDALKKKIAITVQIEKEEEKSAPPFKLMLMNISRGGMALVDKNKLCPKLSGEEKVLWVGTNEMTYNKPVNLVVLHQTDNAHINNLGTNNLLGVKFDAPLSEQIYVRLLELVN